MRGAERDALGMIYYRYESEKNRVEDIKRLREKRDQLKAKIEAAMRMNDVATASDLKYYALPDVEKKYVWCYILSLLSSDADPLRGF
jgi:hypothetical protein